MIYFERDAVGLEVVMDEVIGVPFRRIVDFEGEMTEGAPVTGEDVGAVPLEGGEEFGRG